MNSVSVEPSALTTAATGTHSVAAEIAAHSTTCSVDAATLIPAFGLIGADFAASAIMVTGRHSRELTDLAAGIETVALGLEQAAVTYSGADDHSAGRLGDLQRTRVL